MARQGFSFDACPEAALHLTPDAELNVRAPLPDDLLERAGGAEAFENFRAQLADFAKVSGFFEFFGKHEDLYSELTMIVRKGMQPAVLVGALNRYTGMQVRNATLVLFPLGHPGGFAAQITTPARDDQPAGMEVYALIGPGGAIDDRPTWSTVPWAESLIIHEFAHTIVNPIAGKFAERIARSADRLDPIKQQMSRQAYQSWATVVNEHIVRALEVRIALLHHGVDAANGKLVQDTGRGFVHLPDLCLALDRYEKHRAQWKTLEEFFPDLLAVFE
jgi:hypothetical protein